MPISRSLRGFLPAAALVAALLVSACETTPISGPEEADLRPTAEGPTAVRAAGQAIPGQYIVVFDDGVADAPGLARRLAAEHGGELRFTYEHALKGMALQLPDQAADALARNPNVLRVEPDQTMQASGTQTNATWGLDRIDQRTGLDGLYNYSATGAGVTAYIVDTGIHTAHNDFGGRAVIGFDAIGDGQNGQDCNGHGTHVAGTVGGTTWGVAKDARLVAVRVLDCQGSGSTSGVIAGVDWVTGNAAKPAVANMSLGGGASTSLDEAVQNSIAAGISYAVAAGNGNFIGRQANACNYSPARVPEAMTIGATNDADVKASWSNYGNCVDWFAPGVSITSAWIGGNNATNTINGTSMAAPHVAGVAALYLEASPGASPQQVRDALYDATTKGVVTQSSTANNHLLYSLVGGGGTPVNQPPTAAFSFTTSALTAAFTDASTDSDGTITGWSWSFGDGNTSTAQHPSHTYAASGTYTVALTVTDDAGATGTTSQSVTVSSTGGGGISLSAQGYKNRGRWATDLSWTGAASATVDVFRDGAKITTTDNDGAYTDATDFRGGGTLTYKVCEAGTTTCSNEATVTF